MCLALALWVALEMEVTGGWLRAILVGFRSNSVCELSKFAL